MVGQAEQFLAHFRGKGIFCPFEHLPGPLAVIVPAFGPGRPTVWHVGTPCVFRHGRVRAAASIFQLA